MGKLKLTEEQILMLQKFDDRKIIKLTETQFNRIFEGEQEGLKKVPKSISLANKVKKNFKKGVKTIPDSNIKVEADLLGHPVAGSGGDEYNPQSDEEHEKTFQSFNEGFEGGADYGTYAGAVLDFLKGLINDPTDDYIDPFWRQLNVGRDELISAMSEMGMVDVTTQHGLPKYKVYKESFKEKVRELYKTLSGAEMMPQEEMVQFGNDIELEEEKFDAEYFGNQLKRRTEPRPSDRQIKKKLKKLRKQELKRRKSEGAIGEDNYPAGAANDPSAPWNQEDPKPGRQPEESIYDLVLWHQEHAIFEKGGAYYLFNVESVEDSDYSEYAARDEKFLGYDEDGMPDVEHGEWDMDEEIIANYVNDNHEHLSYGKGIGAWEDGIQMVQLDQELVDDLKGLTKYIKDPRAQENWAKFFNSIVVGETTSAASSGAFVGSMGMGVPKDMGRSPEEEIGTLNEKGKKKKRQKVQQMKQQQQQADAEKSVEKKSGLQTVQVTQQDIKNAMGKHNVYKDRKKEKDKYAGRKDKHKGNMHDAAPDLVNTDDDKLLSEYDWTNVIEFEIPEYGRYRVENVRKPQEKEHAKSYFIELSKEGRPVSSHLVYYLHENGKESLSFVWKYENIISNILDKVDIIFRGELEKLMDQIKGDNVDETTVAGASVDGGSSGPYVTPKMWAKSKKDWVNDNPNKTAWKKGKIVQKDMKPNITMESKNMTDTAYPEGEFVELDDCVRPGNNDKNIAGGCSQGAVDGVVKTKKTSKSVISKEAVYYEVAEKTGRTIEEVKNIIKKSGENE